MVIATAVLLGGVAVVATGAVGGSDPEPSAAGGFADTADGKTTAFAGVEPEPSGGEPVGWVSNDARVEKHEALPCTGPRDPINFEIFSAGPAVAGAPLTGYVRRCDGAGPADEQPANYVNYVYGRCNITAGATACEPPLQIQSFPACQRSLADYSFEGKPMPYKQLPKIGDAEVVEIEFLTGNRIEVYTGSTTIVIFAANPELQSRALTLLRAQQEGEPPASRPNQLEETPHKPLAAPNDGAIEGELPCPS